jgi:hypothetical protein
LSFQKVVPKGLQINLILSAEATIEKFGNVVVNAFGLFLRQNRPFSKIES